MGRNWAPAATVMVPVPKAVELPTLSLPAEMTVPPV